MQHTFEPDEEYDPNRPNDLGEYQHYRRKVREERFARRRREGSESSYYSDSSDAAPRRDGESEQDESADIQPRSCSRRREN